MRHIEAGIQAEVVKALSAHGVYALMIPNGEIGRLTAARYTRLVAQGFRRGAADLILLSPEGKTHFLEMKRPGGKQSPGQVDFQKLCEKKGWPYKLAESAQDAINAATDWGLITRQRQEKAPRIDFTEKIEK
jgi:hypothetical protein